MRIIVVSDTHQHTELLRRCVHQAIDGGPIDALIHCGDGIRDLETVEAALMSANPNVRIYAVKGNCDLTAVGYPLSELADLGGVRALITHGHLYQVKHGLGKLAKAARELGVALAFFGHTHKSEFIEKHGVTLINPGSLASWDVSGTAYLEIQIDQNQKVHVNFIKQR